MKTLFYPILKTKEGIKMKRVFLLLFVLLLAACGRTATPTENTSERSQTIQTSVIHETTMETSTNQASSETNVTSGTQSIPVETQANLVGTWVQENLTLTIDEEGHWQLTGGITSEGTLKVAVDNGTIKMVKLYGFNVNIDSIGNYFIANINEDSSKMNFGYLGTFTRQGQAEHILTDHTYMDVLERETIDFNHNLLGTWTMKNKEYDFQNVWNYNPDGTFEVYSDGKGEAMTGTYQVDYLENDQINLTITYDGGETHTSDYTLRDGTLTEAGFEWAAQIRNTVPLAP